MSVLERLPGLFRRRQGPSAAWAREVVATIPREQLGNHALSFAECTLRTRDPQLRARHWAKLRACCERIDGEPR